MGLMQSGVVLDTTLDDFEEDSKGRVIVDFWAPWCGPCLAMSTMLPQIARESGLDVLKVNVDEEPELVEHYGVKAVPSIGLFVDGSPTEWVVGAINKNALYKKFGL